METPSENTYPELTYKLLFLELSWAKKQPDGILNFSELSELSWSSENYLRKPLDY